MKAIYIDKTEIVKDFIGSHPEYKGKRLTFFTARYAYSITWKGNTLLKVRANDDEYFVEKTRKIYGYCCIYTPKQHYEPQIQKIRSVFPLVQIIREDCKWGQIERPRWEELMKRIMPGDLIVFSSISMIADNIDDALQRYFMLHYAGVRLVFLNEPFVDTDVFADCSADSNTNISCTTDQYFIRIAEKQIRIAFNQASTQMKKAGIANLEHSKELTVQISERKYRTQKEVQAKELILKHCKSFGGKLSDSECIKMAGVSRNTYYRYKNELKYSLYKS